MPAETIVVATFVVCVFLVFMAALAHAQRVAGRGSNRASDDDHVSSAGGHGSNS
jgi:hypothetical protein